jgi:hypothetical protein
VKAQRRIGTLPVTLLLLPANAVTGVGWSTGMELVGLWLIIHEKDLEK